MPTNLTIDAVARTFDGHTGAAHRWLGCIADEPAMRSVVLDELFEIREKGHLFAVPLAPGDGPARWIVSRS